VRKQRIYVPAQSPQEDPRIEKMKWQIRTLRRQIIFLVPPEFQEVLGIYQHEFLPDFHIRDWMRAKIRAIIEVTPVPPPRGMSICRFECTARSAAKRPKAIQRVTPIRLGWSDTWRVSLTHINVM
jgi:hypothetical protein